MRNVTIILTVILTFVSCKKENNATNNESSLLTFYTNNPNTDGLLAEVKISDKNATAFFYGTSNDNTEPKDIKSISFVPNNIDTITNIILDINKRPSIVTFNKKNGQKINTIVKYEYIANDSILYSIYQYDWTTYKDSLLFQAKTKDSYAIKTYGARGFIMDANFRSTTITLVSTLAVAAVACGTIAVLGPPALVWAIANPGWALAGLAFAAGTIANASPNQQIQATTNPNAPISPTSGFIPNPKGTPANPVGYSCNDVILEKLTNCSSKQWKIFYSVTSGITQTSEIGTIWTFNKNLIWTFTTAGGGNSNFTYDSNFINLKNTNNSYSPYTYYLTNDTLKMFNVSGAVAERRFVRQ